MYATIAATVERGWTVETGNTGQRWAGSLGRYAVTVRQFPVPDGRQAASFTAYGDRLPDVIEQACGAASLYDEGRGPESESFVIVREGAEPVVYGRERQPAPIQTGAHAASVRTADADGSRDEPPTPLQLQQMEADLNDDPAGE